MFQSEGSQAYVRTRKTNIPNSFRATDPKQTLSNERPQTNVSKRKIQSERSISSCLDRRWYHYHYLLFWGRCLKCAETISEVGGESNQKIGSFRSCVRTVWSPGRIRPQMWLLFSTFFAFLKHHDSKWLLFSRTALALEGILLSLQLLSLHPRISHRRPLA